MGTHPIFESDFDCLTAMSLTLSIIDAKSKRPLTQVERLNPATSTVGDVKDKIAAQFSVYYKDRQALKNEPKGKMLSDDTTLASLGLSGEGELFFKDLGPQIGWGTVFLAEYAGPLLVYLAFYLFPNVFYAAQPSQKRAPVVDLACACHSAHYIKRILETLFVHRFSHATMPIMNLFKNCSYYWGFAAYMSYYINHPLYTPPVSPAQVNYALIAFVMCEFGNFSIHLLQMNLRPAGSKVRKIPFPNGNPFTLMFNLVSCPNYTYEIGAWASFGIMTQCAPVLIFMACGAAQMTVWALGKHRNYRKEFKDYPHGRKAICPFII